MCKNPRDLTCKRDLDDHSRKDQWACVQFYSSLSWFKKLFCEHSFPSPVFLVFFWVSSWVVAGGHVHLGSGCGSRSHCRHVSRCLQYSHSIYSRTFLLRKVALHVPNVKCLWVLGERLLNCDAPLVLSVNSYPPWEGGICPKEWSDRFFCASLKVMSPFFTFTHGDDAQLSFLNQFLENVMICVPYTKAETWDLVYICFLRIWEFKPQLNWGVAPAQGGTSHSHSDRTTATETALVVFLWLLFQDF